MRSRQSEYAAIALIVIAFARTRSDPSIMPGAYAADWSAPAPAVMASVDEYEPPDGLTRQSTLKRATADI
jgi:hypothetical protein